MEKTLLDNAKSWPFQEARKLLNRKIDKGYILFETGYGPSGLPHIGTFGEVVRTTYVRLALEKLTDIKTKLYAFSDDMDGLRKVPENIPNQELIGKYIGYPLTKVPDPFECHESFGVHNNRKLMEFLDSFGFEYEFQSATDWYKSGRYNDVLLKVLQNHEEILNVMLPSLREERASTYSPFLPICQKTGKILQAKITEYKVDSGTLVYENEEGRLIETEITDGKCKLQWKVDWAARWVALGVDYEMAGKDLIDSVKLSSKICKILGGQPPEGFNYELFLDEEGKKISKSKGNGLSVDDWLKYAPKESLSHFMYASPKSAKKLYFDVIPKNMDDYLSNMKSFKQNPSPDNPVWHIHFHNPTELDLPITFSILLNLVSVCNTDSQDVLWGFITKYVPNASPETMPFLDLLVKHAIVYYNDFIKDNKHYKIPTDQEIVEISDLLEDLKKLPTSSSAENIQECVYEIGKKYYPSELKEWFALLYETIFGQKEGPRIGSFAALYGLENFIELIQKVLIKKEC